MDPSPIETPRGHEGSEFPATPWTTVFAEADGPRRRERLEAFCRRYWRPVFHFIRAVSGEQPDAVKDLTQEFFESILETDLLGRYRAEQGRFRHFLKGALRHFLSQARRDAGRLKRGGGRSFVPLDTPEGALPLEDARQMTPEQLFDRHWADEVLRHAVERLRSMLEAEGKETYHRIYEAYELDPADPPPSYAALAAAHGMAVHDVENRLGYARRLLRKIILEKISEYAGSPDELLEEMNELLRE